MATNLGIRSLEHAGKYIVKSRGLIAECEKLSAIDGANSDNPGLQALAVISVALARVLGVRDDGWTNTICNRLGVSL